MVSKLAVATCLGLCSMSAAAQDTIFSVLSIPALMPLPAQLSADVEFVSDGFQLQKCKVVTSSGDPVADTHACKVVNFKATRKPIVATTPVWSHGTLPENYVRPTAKNRAAPVTTNDYPMESLRKKEQGTTVLRIDLDELGVITRCDVAASSGAKRLDDTARAGFCRRMKLLPASLNGKPVASVNMTTIKFYLGE